MSQDARYNPPTPVSTPAIRSRTANTASISVCRIFPETKDSPLIHTPWRIVQGKEHNLVLEGESDEKGRLVLDDTQQRQLSNACERAPGDVWLVYPGQRIGIRPHREREGWDATRHALGALDFHDTLGGQRAPTLARTPARQARQLLRRRPLFPPTGQGLIHVAEEALQRPPRKRNSTRSTSRMAAPA